MFKQTNSVATTVIVTLVLATTLVLAAFGAGNYFNERSALLQALDDNLEISVKQLATNTAHPLWNFDKVQVNRIIESIMLNREVFGVVIKESGKDKVFAARMRDEKWQIVPTDLDIPASGLVSKKMEITYDHHLLGTAQVFFTKRILKEALRQSLSVIVTTILTLDAALILILYLMLRQTVFRPLKEIESYAAQVSAGIIVAADIKNSGFRGELDRLHRSIQDMVQLLKTSNRDLHDKNVTLESTQAALHEKVDELELQIEARKQAEAELARQHEDLEEIVAARTAELETAQEELLKREKLAVLGQLTATVSHELRNPLGVIQGSAFYLQRKLGTSDEKVGKHLARIEEQVGLCDEIVGELLEYTRGRLSEVYPEEVNTWLTEVLEQVMLPLHVTLARELPPGLPPVSFDREKMRRVVLNIVNNAIQAVIARKEASNRAGKEYAPQVNVRTLANALGVLIEVEDNGTGMDEATATHAFDPLFTTRARGTGLGLAIVKKVVEEHGGTVYLASRLNSGTKITVLLPFEQPTYHAESSMNGSLP